MKTFTVLQLLLFTAAAVTVLLSTGVLADSLHSELHGVEDFDQNVEDSGKWTSRSLLQNDDDDDDDRSPPPPPRRSPPPPSPPPPRRNNPPPPSPRINPPPPPPSPPPPPPRRNPPPPPPRRNPPPPPRRNPPPPPRDSTCRTNRSLCLQPGSIGPDCCNGVCRNVTSDALNCGACGLRCLFGRTCCNRRCVDLMDDRRNCGSCNNVCPPTRRNSPIPGDCDDGLCEYNGFRN